MLTSRLTLEILVTVPVHGQGLVGLPDLYPPLRTTCITDAVILPDMCEVEIDDGQRQRLKNAGRRLLPGDEMSTAAARRMNERLRSVQRGGALAGRLEVLPAGGSVVGSGGGAEERERH